MGQSIKLNFVAIKQGLDELTVYRKLQIENDETRPEGTFNAALFESSKSRSRSNYWVTHSPVDGFEKYTAGPNESIHLTKRALFEAIYRAAITQLKKDDFQEDQKSYYQDLHLNFQKHPEGTEQLCLQTYYLQSQRLFGWLVNYHFAKTKGIEHSRRVQQLSLSLDRTFRRNLDCYLDRRTKIEEFLGRRRQLLESVFLPGKRDPLVLELEFATLLAQRLQPKIYVFGNSQESKSQFNGLKKNGPLRSAEGEPNLLFAFREKDRTAARTLAMTLQGRGRKDQFSFPGFESLFKQQITIDASPIILEDLKASSFQNALENVLEMRESKPATLPVFVLPDDGENGYMELKSLFTSKGIPTQVCTLKLINDEYALKWAIANIALQIFCKAGGTPWKVRPTAKRSLIVGISQSHKLDQSVVPTKVERYFAFSVMTDNSGLFQKLEVLGDSQVQTDYLNELRLNLRRVLSESASGYDQVVLHTSFKLKQCEIAAIESVFAEIASTKTSPQGTDCRFAVVKVNHRNRFFGYNPDVNSLVPFEGTVTRLGGGEYLLWFEGISPDNTTVNKAFAGPTHIQFLKRSTDNKISDESLLQDLINLSGANWRGFNAKSAPVSVFYCHLVADLVRNFQERGLPLPQVKDLKPWFL